jgi:putative hydrolases of HD superfamily
VRSVLIEALALKHVARAGWVRAGVANPESVAAHSWGVAWLVATLCPAHLNRERAMLIALVHDLAEVRVGDITPHDGVDPADKAAAETQAFASMVAAMPNRAELVQAFADYGSTDEGRFVKACDKLDMALQAELYARDGVDTREFIDSALARLDGELAELARGDTP